VAGMALAFIGMLQPGWVNKATVWSLAVALIGAGVAAIHQWRLARGDVTEILSSSSKARRTGAAVLFLVIGALCSADHGPVTTPVVVGDLALFREDGAPTVVFQQYGGGIGYCSRTDDHWWTRWKGPTVAPSWPVMHDLSVFASVYDGLELLGRQGETLFFGYRDGRLRWYPPRRIEIGGRGLLGVRGHAAFLQSRHGQVTQFFALVPEIGGGVGLYERADYEGYPFEWYRRGVIVPELGSVDSVAAVDAGQGNLQVIIRVGSRLFWTFREQGNLPEGFTLGWQPTREIRASGHGLPRITGDPALILSQPNRPSLPLRLQLAVPVADGLMLMTTSGPASSPWIVERLPVNQRVDSVSILEGYAQDRRNLLVIYRLRNTILYSWKSYGGLWQYPLPLRCGYFARHAA
jgi:hypothetical protein